MANEYQINDSDIVGVKGKTVVVTGGSSGIGLATVELLLSVGASVVDADMQPPVKAIESPAFSFHKTDVTVWKDLLALFKKTKETHGSVDHVFANAGISIRGNYLTTDLDENGDLVEPSFQCLDVNLRGVINTTTVAAYYMRQQESGGSVVIAASTTGFQRFRAVDYSTSKHAVIGFMRGMRQSVEANKVPVRVNAVAPGWTESSIMPKETLALFDIVGVPLQSPDYVARAVAHLMADETRNGHLVHVAHGRFKEIDEGVLLPAFRQINGDHVTEEETVKLMAEYAEAAKKQATTPV